MMPSPCSHGERPTPCSPRTFLVLIHLQLLPPLISTSTSIHSLISHPQNLPTLTDHWLPSCRLSLSRGLGDTARPAVQCAACTALATLFTPCATNTNTTATVASSSSSSATSITTGEGTSDATASASRKQEGRASVQSLLSAFSSPLAQLATSGEESTRLAALTAIKGEAGRTDRDEMT